MRLFAVGAAAALALTACGGSCGVADDGANGAP